MGDTAVETNAGKHGFEDILQYMGPFGKFQKIQCLLLSIPIIVVAMHSLSLTFVAATPKYRCFIPGWDDHVNSSQAWSFNQSMIYPWDADKEEYSKCLIYNVTVSNGSWLQEPDNTTAELTCTRWVYDTSQYKTTVLSKWDMVCDQTYMKNLAQSLYMAGMGVGAVLFGDFSDRFGRKIVLLFSQLMQIGCGIGMAFAPEYISFVIFRFLLGMSHSGVLLVAYVIGMEFVGREGKVIVGISYHATFAIGFLVLALEGYFIREWKWLVITITVPGCFFLVYLWDRILTRSARWLLQNHRKEECISILEWAASVNGHTIPPDALKELKVEVKERVSILQMFKYKRMRRSAFIVFYNWFTTSMVYWGLSLTSSEIPGGNDYSNLALSGGVEFIGLFFCFLTMNSCGRRPTLSMSMVFTGIALLCVMFVPKGLIWLNILLSLTGKAFSAASFCMVYQYSAELFPTVIRNSVIGMSSFWARIGGILAPFVNLIGTVTHPYVPLITFGACSLLAGILALVLPETLNKEMPESLEQGEMMGVKTKLKKENIYASNDEGTKF